MNIKEQSELLSNQGQEVISKIATMMGILGDKLYPDYKESFDSGLFIDMIYVYAHAAMKVTYQNTNSKQVEQRFKLLQQMGDLLSDDWQSFAQFEGSFH